MVLTPTARSARPSTPSCPGSGGTTAAPKTPWKTPSEWPRTALIRGGIRLPGSGRSAGDCVGSPRTLVLERPSWTSPVMQLSHLPVWIRKTSEDMKMNLAVIKWLLAHREVLTQILEVVKGWHKDLPLEAHWEIVDKVARLVIPVLTKQDVAAMLDSPFEDAVSSFALGAEANALGVDWVKLIQLIVPILQAILQAFATGEDD